jgi:hypothetical protein
MHVERADTAAKATMKAAQLARNNVILLFSLLVLILFYPQFEAGSSLVRDLLLSAVFFLGIFSLELSARSRRLLLPLAGLTIATTWIHHFHEGSLLYLVDFGTTSITLAAIVVLMIRHIARSRIVTPTIILNLPNRGTPEFSDYLYMAFITLTTVGYGDVTATSHLTRSVAILIGLAGQLYMTILIAMLVGKFLASQERR